MAAIDGLSISSRRWLLLPARHHLVSLLPLLCLPKEPQRSFQIPLCFCFQFPILILCRSVPATIYTPLFFQLNLSPQV